MPHLRTYIVRLVILSVTFSLLATYTFRERLLSITASIRVFSSTYQDIIDTGYAKYQGNRTFPNTVAYLGIPYAEPPLGDRRFRAPVPLDTARIARSSKSTVVDATKYPDFCIQGNTGGLFSFLSMEIAWQLTVFFWNQVVMLEEQKAKTA